MMNKGCCFRLAAWLALSGLPGAGMAEMLPAEEVLLPAPSACRSDRAAVVTAQDSCDMRDRLLRYFATCGQEKPLSGSLKRGEKNA